MKPFLPFLLIPLLGLGGWAASAWTPAPDPLAIPTVLKLDPPPALGVAIPPPASDGPVAVSLDALLPLLPSEVLRQADTQKPPTVNAILVLGVQRLAQVNGMPMGIGESVGDFRIADIETDRVLFVQHTVGKQRWVPLTDQ